MGRASHSEGVILPPSSFSFHSQGSTEVSHEVGFPKPCLRAHAPPRNQTRRPLRVDSNTGVSMSSCVDYFWGCRHMDSAHMKGHRLWPQPQRSHDRSPLVKTRVVRAKLACRGMRPVASRRISSKKRQSHPAVSRGHLVMRLVSEFCTAGLGECCVSVSLNGGATGAHSRRTSQTDCSLFPPRSDCSNFRQ